MMSYALAMMKHDPDREVLVNLRFTEGGRTESFSWSMADRESLSTEVIEIGKAIE
jgi:hypothetical protein